MAKNQFVLILKTNDLNILKNIISKSDIFIQNLMPGATERLGIGSSKLRSMYPSLSLVISVDMDKMVLTVK